MSPKPRLSLHRETLRALSSGEARRAAAGGATDTACAPCAPSNDVCPTDPELSCAETICICGTVTLRSRPCVTTKGE